MLINGEWRVLVQANQYAAIMPEGFFRCLGADKNQFKGTPWSHQAYLMWCLKGLDAVVDVRIVVHPSG